MTESSIGNATSAIVVGAGQMGAGIAHVLAQSGVATQLFDAVPGAVEKAIAGIGKRLDSQIEKGKLLPADKTSVLGNLKPLSKLESAGAVDVVIEAIVENIPAKLELFQALDAQFPVTTLLGSNTSSISITRIAAAAKHPERVVGLHFMNPVPVMKLVEVIRGLQTSDATYARAIALVHQLSKTPVAAQRDYPGFVVNRILVPMINEAFFALMEGIASAEDIDQAMKLGTNQPMGPLELADFIGLDTCHAICKIFQTELGDDKYRPCPLLTKYVEAGWLGRKAGRGVYTY